MENSKTPPIGLTPRWLHNEKRIDEIIGAIKRYSEADIVPPIDWINELDELVKQRHIFQL